MRLSLLAIGVSGLLAISAPPTTLQAAMQDVLPRCVSVEPMSGKPGAEIVVTGENLDKEHVAEPVLYGWQERHQSGDERADGDSDQDQDSRQG